MLAQPGVGGVAEWGAPSACFSQSLRTRNKSLNGKHLGSARPAEIGGGGLGTEAEPGGLAPHPFLRLCWTGPPGPALASLARCGRRRGRGHGHGPLVIA